MKAQGAYPCPFCGTPPMVRRSSSDQSVAHVWCPNVNSSLTRHVNCGDLSIWRDSKGANGPEERAVKAWNKAQDRLAVKLAR